MCSSIIIMYVVHIRKSKNMGRGRSMEDKRLDLSPYVVSAILMNPKTWHLIDNIYAKYETELITHGIGSKYWDSPPIVALPARSMVYAKKLLCIAEYINNKHQHNESIPAELDETISTLFYNTYKKAFNEIYQQLMTYDKIELLKIE